MQNNELLAKVLAAENIQVNVTNDRTASFDVVNRVLRLPDWKDLPQVVTKMLIHHEVGHALFTPAEYLDVVNNKRELQTILNVVEDVRIETLFKEEYPGAVKDFVSAAKALHDTDFFELAGRDSSTMKFIDRLNVFFKLNGNFPVKFTASEAPFVARVRLLRDFEDALALADEILSFIRDEVQKKQEQQLNLSDIEIEEDDEVETYPGDDSAEFDDEEDESEESHFDEGNSRNESKNSTPSDLPADLENELQSSTMDTLNRKLRVASSSESKTYDFDALANSSPKMKYVSFKELLEGRASINSEDDIFYQNEKAKAFKAKVSKQINHMISVFEMRKAAKIYAKREVRKTGALDHRLISQYKVKEDLFRRNTIVPEGQNHGMVLLLDWSGSMLERVGNSNTRLSASLDQVSQLVMFCRKLGIPHAVFAFAEDASRKPYLMELFNNRMSITEYNDMLAFVASRQITAQRTQFGTPLAPALVEMQNFIPKFKSMNKLDKVNLITFTDGVNTSPLTEQYSYSRFSQIIDSKTGKRYSVRNRETEIDRGYSPKVAEINAYYSILRDRCDCNIITFFVKAKTDKANSYLFFSGVLDNNAIFEMLPEAKKQMKSRGFYEFSGFSRDRAYIVSDSALIAEDVEITQSIDSDMSAAAIAKTMNKNSSSGQAKLLVEKFIECIS